MRAGAVLERLLERVPARLTVIGPQAAALWPARLKAASEWIASTCDVGVEQSDDVTVDAAGTGAALRDWLGELPRIVERETERLRGGFDLVFGDVPAPAFEAAAAADVESVALANFSWDWIYRELGFEAAAVTSAAMYAKAGLLLEAAPSAPMEAFPRRQSIGLVARRPAARRDSTRARLGISDEERLVLLALRPDSASLVRLPEPSPGVSYLLPAGWRCDRRRDDLRVASSIGFLDLLEVADAVVGKPGYGLIGDVAASATRLLYVARPGFPENAVLEAWLEQRCGTRRVAREALRVGAWAQDLRALLAEPRPAPLDLPAAEVAAEVLAACLAA